MAAGEAQRVAFFGGSFDPPHLGHLAVARAARHALQLDTILFAPVGVQPLKPNGASASFEDRVRMTELAVAGEPGFQVSSIDAPDSSRHPNFTLETLRRIRTGLPPGAELFCIMGADSFLTLNQWHGAALIPFAATLIVASRPGQSLNDLQRALPRGLVLNREPESNSSGEHSSTSNSHIALRTYTLRNASGDSAEFHVLPGLDIEISASDIRQQLHSGAEPATARQLLPPAVTQYIRNHSLYR